MATYNTSAINHKNGTLMDSEIMLKVPPITSVAICNVDK